MKYLKIKIDLLKALAIIMVAGHLEFSLNADVSSLFFSGYVFFFHRDAI